jgi:hypothetical protein
MGSIVDPLRRVIFYDQQGGYAPAFIAAIKDAHSAAAHNGALGSPGVQAAHALSKAIAIERPAAPAIAIERPAAPIRVRDSELPTVAPPSCIVLQTMRCELVVLFFFSRRPL